MSTSRYRARERGEEVPDESGDVAEKMARARGDAVLGRELVSDDGYMIRAALNNGMKTGADVVLFTGGTGLAPTDITIETIRPVLEKEMEGFGEVFRAISYRRIGAPAAFTRATAGAVEGRLVLCLPGSPDGVETALDSFIEDFPHLMYVLRGPKWSVEKGPPSHERPARSRRRRG